MIRRITLIVAAIVLVAAFTVQPAGAATVIKGSGTSWQPHAVNISVGAKVTWKAVSGSHTVTAYKGKWTKNTTIAQGTATSFTFKSKGVYKFRCRFHSTLSNGVCSGMCGKVVVG